MKVNLIHGRDVAELLPELTWSAPEVLMVMPCVDKPMAQRCAAQMAARAGAAADGLIACLYDEDREGFIALTNRAFQVSRSACFGYVAQDAFAGRHWLAVALKALRGSGKGLFAFNDGKWMGALAAFGLARRDWASGNYAGAFFHSAYARHYADVELTLLAMNGGAYCYDANSVLVEVDWDKESVGVCPADRALYKERAQAGFDGRVSSPRLLGLFA